VLVALVFAQSVILFRSTIAPLYADARDVRGLPALQRGAILSFGDTFAAYTGFLRAHIPEAGRVVIPPFDLDPVYGNLGLMQFFLFPREVVNCPSGPDLPSCTSSMTSPRTYLLRVGAFPDPASLSRGRHLLEFSDHLGTYAPPGQADPLEGTTPQAIWQTDTAAWISPASAVTRFIAGGLMLGLFAAAGALLVATLLGTSNPWAYAGLYFPVGFGTVTWLLFLGSLVHLPLPTSILVVGLLIAFVGLAHLGARRKRGQKPPTHQEHPNPDTVIWVVLGLGLVFLSALSIGLAYSEWDAMAFWSIKGYGIAWGKDILASPSWGAPGQSHPISIPIGIAVVRLLQGDTEPISKALNPVFFASLSLGCFQFWRRRSTPGVLALACALILSSVPILVEHATNGYANLPAACYLVLGTITFVQGAIEQNGRLQWLGGWMLGLATWTRSDALPMLVALAPALYLTLRAARGTGLCARCLVVPTLLIGGSWLVAAPSYTSGGYAMDSLQNALVSILRGEWNLTPIYQTVRALGGDLSEPKVWGVLLATSITLAASAATSWRTADRHAGIPILSSALAAGVMMLAMFYALTSQGPVQLWLDTGLTRLFLPPILLAWVGLVTLAIGLPIGDSAPRPEGRSSCSSIGPSGD